MRVRVLRTGSSASSPNNLHEFLDSLQPDGLRSVHDARTDHHENLPARHPGDATCRTASRDPRYDGARYGEPRRRASVPRRRSGSERTLTQPTRARRGALGSGSRPGAFSFPVARLHTRSSVDERLTTDQEDGGSNPSGCMVRPEETSGFRVDSSVSDDPAEPPGSFDVALVGQLDRPPPSEGGTVQVRVLSSASWWSIPKWARGRAVTAV